MLAPTTDRCLYIILVYLANEWLLTITWFSCPPSLKALYRIKKSLQDITYIRTGFCDNVLLHNFSKKLSNENYSGTSPRFHHPMCCSYLCAHMYSLNILSKDHINQVQDVSHKLQCKASEVISEPSLFEASA